MPFKYHIMRNKISPRLVMAKINCAIVIPEYKLVVNTAPIDAHTFSHRRIWKNCKYKRRMVTLMNVIVGDVKGFCT